MRNDRFLLATTWVMALTLALAAAASAQTSLPPHPSIDITNYVIHVDLDPAKGRLSATAAVTFTALQDSGSVAFGMNRALQVQSVTDNTHANLVYATNASDATVLVTPTAAISKGSRVTWTFTYAGVPTLATSPVSGTNFVQVHDPVSALLYPGRWFPIAPSGLSTDRFTAKIYVTVPEGESVVGSSTLPAHARDLGDGRTEFDLNWTTPGFPGSLIVGKFEPAQSAPGAVNVHLYLTQQNQTRMGTFATTVAQELSSMSAEFGTADVAEINVVELPEDSVSAAWAPGIVAIKPSRVSARLLANTVAHQWWGSQVSPATLGDAWITNGMSRYAELMYLEETNGRSAFLNAVTDVEAGAMAYDTEPLTSLGHDPFSPQFQSMTLEKGAIIFHMLRWEMGDAVFQQFLQALVKQYSNQSVRTADVVALAENISKLPLKQFFSQWVDGTGAPEYVNSYSVFRLGDGKGYRTDGSLSQDLDLFAMPVALRIDTEGKTVNRRVDIAGEAAKYSIDTMERPTTITVDPDNWLLKSTPQLTVRTDILLGQQALARNDPGAAIAAYQKALAVDRGSSLANYRLAEVYLSQKNYQSAANSFRDCLRGDLDPKWTEVWSHVNLGKIFDIAGQRERAVNEYRLAIQTKDNTQGAVNEAHALVEKPYKPLPDSAP